jgi:PPOX class probable F420-dependent enzyme
VTTSTSSTEFHPSALELARGRNFAAVTTIMPSGLPQTHMIWVHTDGEHLILNTEVHRQKFLNVERDPRITVMIRDEENPYRYAEVRGEVVEKVRGQEARDNIDELSRKYRDEDYPPDNIKTERVMLRIAARRQTIFE